MTRFRVSTGRRAYPVVVGQGAWRELCRFSSSIQSGGGDYSSIFILTEAVIWNRWGDAFRRQSGLETARVLFTPGGEASKSLREAGRLWAELQKHGADRRSLLVLFGGGVTGDLGAFVASTYMRGIDCVQVPTTLVAQVDSSVGGKTAVNLGAAKNLVGTFHPPRLVLSDPVVLGSLPSRIFRSGLYEVVKHAILAGPRFFGQLEQQLDAIDSQNPAALETLVAEAVKVKVQVVNHDEREAALRQTLNLGHTFGHALEAATGYRRFLHGEAVGWGLLAVTLLAERLGVLRSVSSPARITRGAYLPSQASLSDGQRIRRLVERIGPLPSIRDVSWSRIARLLPRDKKAVRGQVHWVIPERIGKVRIKTEIPLSAAREAWRELQAAKLSSPT